MKNSEIGEVLMGGKSYQSTSFCLRFLPSKKPQKIAFIASKKLFKTAVLRNKMRRMFRAATLPYLKAIQNNKFVISINKAAENKTVKEINEEVKKVLDKSDMLK